MKCAATFLASLLAALTAIYAGEAAPAPRGPLDPRGKIHIPIGIANSVDTLKTFVEAEGDFSPGFGTYGIYFWAALPDGTLVAPTQPGKNCQHGLASGGRLIPWSAWKIGDDVEVCTEVCETRRPSPQGEVFVVGARVTLSNDSRSERTLSLYVALRPLGAAGGPVRSLSVSADGCALLADGHSALVANETPSAAGVSAADSIGDAILAGKFPDAKAAKSESGDCSGALRFDITLNPVETKTLGFVCPVLPGRRAVGHKWDGESKWAQFDLNKPNPPDGGVLQPDPGLDYYRGIKAETLFSEAEAYWKDLVGRATIQLPDKRWSEAFAAITGHAALCMNEGAPDVAVVNYNVFNRDGVYVASILQKAGHFELAAACIDYFLAHPFNGRVQPEADNPGQILWIMEQHWQFTRDKAWLERVYPAARKIAAMIAYYRTTPEPHWVSATSLGFGEALPKEKRQKLIPGSCDGKHPEYTEAFDIAGLGAAVTLAEAMGQAADAAAWRSLAAELFEKYDKTFGAKLGKGYGSYCVLWPCQLYPFNLGRGWELFRLVGAQKPTSWRYFPLATAHQGLLAGNRAAAHGTLELHLQHEQMKGWYAFDEGGASGTGGWNHVRTTWKQGKDSVAMPHGWAIAEFHLLLRDSLAFEDGDKLVLLSGVPPEWFTAAEGMRVDNLPTHFGTLSFDYKRTAHGATLAFSGTCAPPSGFVLRLPKELKAAVKLGAIIASSEEVGFPAEQKTVELQFAK